GKAVSRYNAQKHAILRETVTPYEKADAAAIFNDLVDDLKPVGRFQELLVEMIAANVVRLQRIAKTENDLIQSATDRGITLKPRAYEAQIDHTAGEKSLLYSRYQTASENRIYRALAVLKQLQIHDKT